MDWRADQEMSELWDIISMVSDVEDIPIAEIRDACDAKGISCEKFIEVWRELCDEAHIIVGQAEGQMNGIH